MMKDDAKPSRTRASGVDGIHDSSRPPHLTHDRTGTPPDFPNPIQICPPAYQPRMATGDVPSGALQLVQDLTDLRLGRQVTESEADQSVVRSTECNLHVACSLTCWVSTASLELEETMAIMLKLSELACHPHRRVSQPSLPSALVRTSRTELACPGPSALIPHILPRSRRSVLQSYNHLPAHGHKRRLSPRGARCARPSGRSTILALVRDRSLASAHSRHRQRTSQFISICPTLFLRRPTVPALPQPTPVDCITSH
ncbi:hypothetical protein C8Q77DRAFT_15979 [Trametes polyzona]|nr:hypothetical protein C8Q77DRAFT_15979 [Trametes polyzona]